MCFVVISRGTCIRGANVRPLADHVTLQFQGWVTQHNPYRLAIGKERVPMQLAQCWFPIAWPFPMLKYKYIFFQIKYTEAILSNVTRKLLWFEITKMLIAV